MTNIIIPDDYPNTPAQDELSSDYLSKSLIETYQKKCKKICKKGTKENQCHKLPCYNILKELVTNRLSICYDEIKKLKKMFK
eukprot:UN17893